jgi:hypothetical protein
MFCHSPLNLNLNLNRNPAPERRLGLRVRVGDGGPPGSWSQLTSKTWRCPLYMCTVGGHRPPLQCEGLLRYTATLIPLSQFPCPHSLFPTWLRVFVPVTNEAGKAREWGQRNLVPLIPPARPKPPLAIQSASLAKVPLGTAPLWNGVAKARPLPVDPGYAGGFAEARGKGVSFPVQPPARLVSG